MSSTSVRKDFETDMVVCNEFCGVEVGSVIGEVSLDTASVDCDADELDRGRVFLEVVYSFALNDFDRLGVGFRRDCVSLQIMMCVGRD